MNKQDKELMDEVYSQLTEEENKIFQKNEKLLKQIGKIRSEEYKDYVEACLLESEANGVLSFVDISTLNPKHRQEDDWLHFDHIYVDQQTNGGYTGDEFSGYIWIPITKKLYLKSFYSM